MFTLKALAITIDIPPEYDSHNHDLVGYVIQRYPRRVLKASILTRNSIESWYEDSKTKYPKDKHIYLIGTVSLVGEVIGVREEPRHESAHSGTVDPQAN